MLQESLLRVALIMMMVSPAIYNLTCAGSGVRKGIAVFLLALSLLGYLGTQAVF